MATLIADANAQVMPSNSRGSNFSSVEKKGAKTYYKVQHQKTHKPTRLCHHRRFKK